MKILILHFFPVRYDALFHNLCIQSFTYLLRVSALLSRYLRGADTKMSLKRTAKTKRSQ